jgi:flagella basal body P-ring formation protein FlgA
MIWAKESKKQLIERRRAVTLAVYTVALCMLSVAAMAEETVGDYRITLQQAEQAIAQELARKGMGQDVQASIIGRRNQDLVQRPVPVAMDVATLEADAANQRFTATLSFMTEASLERPAQQLGSIDVSGRYEEMVEVPVVKFRLSSGDIIREEDVEWQKLPSARVKREAVLETAELVGKSVVRGLTPGRPVMGDEIQQPPVVLRRSPVRIRYQSNNLSIQAVGTAMQDGAMGDKIKVRNDDSGIEVAARVVARGQVEVMPAVAFN